MKTYFIILCIIAAAVGYVHAQPSYNANNYASPGDTFLITRYSSALINLLPVNQTGQNYTWNFATMGASSQEVYRYKTADNSGYRASFIAGCILGGGNIFSCLAQWYSLTNQARQIPGIVDLLEFELQNVTELEKKSSTKLEISLMGATINMNEIPLPIVIQYDAPDIVYRFPLTYNLKDTSVYNYGIDLTPTGQDFTYSAHVRRINHTDGYGTLITPYKTYQNVIRLKTIIEHQDTAVYNSTVYPLSYNELKYSWLSTTKGMPVLTCSGYLQSGIPVLNAAEYMDTLRCFTPSAAFMPLPPSPIVDATTGTVSVHFYNASTNCNTYTWNFGDSLSMFNVSHEASPDHIYTKAGTYHVKLTGCNTVCNPDKCDTADFWVYVRDTFNAIAGFSYYPQNPCPFDSVMFTSLSQNADSLVWIFDDSESLNGTVVWWAFYTGGAHTAKLVAMNQHNSDSIVKTIEVKPFPFAYAGADTMIYKGDTAQLHGIGNEGDTYNWQPASHLSCSGCQLPKAFPDTSMVFILTTSGSCGTASDSMMITVTDTTAGAGNNIKPSRISVFNINHSGVIQVKLPEPGSYLIEIIDITGQIKLKQELIYAGETCRIHAGSLKAGCYYIRISQNINNFAVIRKITIVR